MQKLEKKTKQIKARLLLKFPTVSKITCPHSRRKKRGVNQMDELNQQQNM